MRRLPAPLLAATFLLLALAVSGCVGNEHENDVFFHGTNFEAKDAVTAVLNDFRDGVNARDVSRAMSAWPEGFRYPDEVDPSVVHTAGTMREGWREFFARADLVAYGYDDLFLRIDEANAYADVKVIRSFRGHAPFVHTVDDAEYERLYFKKDADGYWRFSTAPHRLLPPQILDR